MTAEVAVLNKLAVALAADSAVTASSQHGAKIFNTANKLFALSTYAPVGTMSYGNAEFMGVPWETVIKVYRGNLGDRKFDTLREYAADFLGFLNGLNPMFPAEQQDHYFRASLVSYLTYVKDTINGKAQAAITRDGSIDNAQVEQIVSSTIAEEHKTWEGRAQLAPVPPEHALEIVSRYKDLIKQVRNDILQKLPIDATSYGKLETTCSLLFTKDFFLPNVYSGVVIAGFGEREIFPSLLSFGLEGIVCDKLKYKEERNISITPNMAASIVPFAQSEMVHSFMEGIEPALGQFVDGYLAQVFRQAPEFVADALNLTDAAERAQVAAKVNEAVGGALADFRKQLHERQQQGYISPIINAVAMLPKDELAQMAESLVSLTSFKRRISMQHETVGGPVDVAVISKGDGLIWIKRKHYFEPELNARYFKR